MTLLLRLITAAVLFGVLFIVAFFGICMVGGGVAGAKAGANSRNQQEGYEAGQRAGAQFVEENMSQIVSGSGGIAVFGAIALSFSGILPWCRKPQMYEGA